MKMNKEIVYIAINTDNDEPLLRTDSFEKMTEYINSYNRQINYEALKIIKAVTTYEEV